MHDITPVTGIDDESQTISIESIRKALTVCQAFADGDFEARITNIDETGEVGELMWTINRMIDRTDAFIQASTSNMQYVAQNKYYRRIAEEGTSGSFRTSAQIANNAVLAIETKINDFSGVVENFQVALNSAISNVTGMSSQLGSSAQVMDETATKASDQSNAVASAAEEASANVATVAAASEELLASIDEISRQTAHSSKAATEAVEKVTNTTVQIKGLEDTSKKIGQIIKLINDIARQTNLLALNATIEAARAGEAGKGFAVVASEVKVLANQTAKATEEISAQITAIQTSTDSAVSAIDETSHTITELNEIAMAISAAVEEQEAATREIARNVEQASAGTGEVSRNIVEISTGVQDTSNIAKEVLTASDDLSAQAASLNSELETFMIEVEKVI
ncbi:MAG: methyl-accepting chemotaxis protein [Rhodospirillales bacterium]|nr:methyl-accepting chemotaxis protein [Rhodospirillales bacterium]